MTILQELDQYLASEGLVSGFARISHAMPDGGDDFICYYEYANNLPDSNEIVGISHYIQIVVRSKTHEAAFEQSNKMFKALRPLPPRVQLTDERWAQITTISSPLKIKVDERDRVYVGFNLICTTN